MNRSHFIITAVSLAVAPACATFLGFDDSLHITERDASEMANDARNADDAPVIADGGNNDSDGDLLQDVRTRDYPPTCESDAGDCVIDCTAGACIGWAAQCQPGRPCRVLCAGVNSCPYVACATNMPCVIVCRDRASCAGTKWVGSTAQSACLRCGACDHVICSDYRCNATRDFPSGCDDQCMAISPTCQ